MFTWLADNSLISTFIDLIDRLLNGHRGDRKHGFRVCCHGLNGIKMSLCSGICFRPVIALDHFTTFLTILSLYLESNECVNNVILMHDKRFPCEWWRHNDSENGENQLLLPQHTTIKLAINGKVRAIPRNNNNSESTFIKSHCWLVYFPAYLNWNLTRQHLTHVFLSIWVWSTVSKACHLTDE